MLNDLIAKALKGGWRTTEFWLALMAILVPVVGPLVFTDKQMAAVNAWGIEHGTFGLVVVAAYVLARGYVKGQAARSLPQAVGDENRMLALTASYPVAQRQSTALDELRHSANRESVTKSPLPTPQSER